MSQWSATSNSQKVHLVQTNLDAAVAQWVNGTLPAGRHTVDGWWAKIQPYTSGEGYGSKKTE